jgi:hydroxymethylglutaryl-CoA lyase
MNFPRQVRIVEVGPRDGLQNESALLPTATKVELIHRLAAAGLKSIEATAFVSPQWVPQMSDNAAVLRAINRQPGISYPVLTPNLRGLEAALAAGATEVAVFAAASETFSQKNINCSIADSLARFKPLIRIAHEANVRVRGYVSCVLGSPYGEAVDPQAVARVAAALFAMGCYEISLGDTIGTGTPLKTQGLIEVVSRQVPVGNLAGHYHDSYGMAVANVYASLEMGMAVFDSSIAGLGGCPYARGASGNVPTEELAWLMQGLGIETGIDLDELVRCAEWISGLLGRSPNSHVSRSLLSHDREAG